MVKPTMKFVLVFFLSLVAICWSKLHVCYFSTYLSAYHEGDNFIRCHAGCCGYYYNRHCCYYINGGEIAAIVIGSLFAVAIVISCSVCLCCIARNRRARRGSVYNPGAQPGCVIATAKQLDGQQLVDHAYPYPADVNEPGTEKDAYMAYGQWHS